MQSISQILRDAKRRVQVNCRTPTVDSTKLSLKEKLDWVAYIAILTVIPVGLQLKQFYATSAYNVNKEVNEELARRGRLGEGASVNTPARTPLRRDATL